MMGGWRTRDPSLPRSSKPVSEQELRVRANSLVGARIEDIATALRWPLPRDEKAAKGYIGQLIESALGSDVDAHERPDFVDLQIECKTVPCFQDEAHEWRPKESTFVCSIRALDAADATWETSRVKERLGAVLWVAVQSAQTAPLPKRRVVATTLWRPDQAQWAKLRGDWEDLMGAIGAGRGHSLGAHEGEVMQVRPKAATNRARVLGMQEDGLGAILPLGFYLRSHFVASILQSSLP